MDGEMNSAPDLWVHRESAVIRAESHDIWSFTPEFLLANQIVPDEWMCRSAKREPDVVDIQYGPIHWRMTESDLWISMFPDCPVSSRASMADKYLVAAMAKGYIERVPYSPLTSVWFNWRISSVNSNRHQWMLDNFLTKGWPEEAPITGMQPVLDFSSDGARFQITVQNDQVQRQYETFDDSTVFNCYAQSTREQVVAEAALATDHWSNRLQLLKRAINYLLVEGDV